MSKREQPGTPLDSADTAASDRRTFMQALGAGAASMFGTQAAKGYSTNAQTMDTFETKRNRLNLGGRLVVGKDAYGTISQAYADAESGDTIYVHSSYDAQAVGEPFPIQLDYEQKEVMLTGGHPSGSVIDASHSDQNVIEVLGRGMNDYRNNPMVRNLKIVGGNIGLRVQAAPFAAFHNLVFYRTGSHGAHIQPYTDPDSGRDKGTFGVTFDNCQAWSCGGDGFRTETAANTHGTAFLNCASTNNDGAGFRLRGYTTTISGGVAQLNQGPGVEARDGKANFLQGVYIEGNGRSEDYPIDVYANNADGLTITDCYFNGHSSRSTTHGYDGALRGVNAHATEKLSVSNCTVRNYGEGFLALFDCEDADVHAASHYLLDVGNGLFAIDPTNRDNYRLRSDGVIMPTDLTAVQGSHDCDMGYHVDSEREGMAIWRDGQWHLAETTTL